MTFSFKKEVRDINRLRQIATVLFEEGFGYLVGKIRLKVPLSKRIKQGLIKKEKTAPAIRLRLTLERLGPTFIKLGQLLSVRPDLLPKEYITELEKLQDRVEEFPFEFVEKEIRKELKKGIKELFSSFDKKPVASASISQVHKARLKTGELVAVKVQRPHAKEIMETDIEIMFHIARLIEKHMPEAKKYNPVRIVEEFADWTKDELDFRVEARNAKRFYHNFKGSRIIRIPKIYDKYTTEKILVMEFIDGVELHNIRKIKTKRFDIEKVMKDGFRAFLTQVFVHGFFHADPHPGNILVMKNNKIGLVDFGIVGYFSEELKRRSLEIFEGIVKQDVDKVTDAFLSMGVVENKNCDSNLFRRKIRKVIEPLHDSELKDINLSSVLEEVLEIALDSNIKMPTDFALFGKMAVTLEGIALGYNPKFKLIENSKPFIEDLLKKKYDLKYMVNRFIESANKFGGLITKLPEQTNKALERIQQGNIKIDIEDTDIKKLSLEIDKSSNRLAYGMVIAALVIAGALTINVGNEIAFGLPLISLLCFLFAALLGLVLLVSILSERRLK